MYKGHDTTIRALPLVQAKVPGARYVVAGGGPLREYLGRVAQSVGVERDVEFLGEVPDDALVDLYRSADVLAVLSRESASVGGAEGFGIVCLEAAACGIPVVAGRSGGLVDAVQDGVTGILVDPLDLGAAAEAIVALLGDPDRARRMGAAGRAAVLDHFTWDHMAREARRLFEEAATR
jgi:phosphatidylinositol alpha-1,6-mannosyltransferase